MKRPLLACAALCFAAAAHAQEAPHYELIVMGKSWHFGQSIEAGWIGQNWNQYNPGLGLEYRWPNSWFVGALTYYDSWRNQAVSVYGGYQLTAHITPDFAVFAAARAGYMHGSGVNGLAVMPSVGVTYKRLTLEASFVPKAVYRGDGIGNSGVNVVGLFARWRF